MANAQRCGALAEPGIAFCAVHAKAKGYTRCPCGTWFPFRLEHRGKCMDCERADVRERIALEESRRSS